MSSKDQHTHIKHYHMIKHNNLIITDERFAVPETAPIVFCTLGELSSVRTPSPPTAGPHEKGPALKSIKAHLIQNILLISMSMMKVCIYSSVHVWICMWTSGYALGRERERERERETHTHTHTHTHSHRDRGIYLSFPIHVSVRHSP